MLDIQIGPRPALAWPVLPPEAVEFMLPAAGRAAEEKISAILREAPAGRTSSSAAFAGGPHLLGPRYRWPRPAARLRFELEIALRARQLLRCEAAWPGGGAAVSQEPVP